MLGPPRQPALFDRFLPKEMPMSCINRQVGMNRSKRVSPRSRGGPSGPFPGWKTIQGSPRSSSGPAACARTRPTPGLWLYGPVGHPLADPGLGTQRGRLAAAAWDQSWNPANKNSSSEAAGGTVRRQCARFDSRMAATDDPPLYQSVRFNMAGYHLDMPNGTYAVTLNSWNRPTTGRACGSSA